MGPLVSEAARDRFLRAVGAADGEPLVSGGPLENAPSPAYVRPSLHRVARRDPGSAYQRDEHFGPDIAAYVVEDLDEAIAVTNDTEFGLVTSLFSQSNASWDEFRLRARSGVLHRNRSTAGATGRLPFGGLGKSGNHRPGGVHMIRSCASPVATFEGASASALPPGFPKP